jgi:hypothetical protein
MFRTFSLTVQLKEMDEPCWIPCIEWNNEFRLFQKATACSSPVSSRSAPRRTARPAASGSSSSRPPRLERAKIQIDEAT